MTTLSSAPLATPTIPSPWPVFFEAASSFAGVDCALIQIFRLIRRQFAQKLSKHRMWAGLRPAIMQCVCVYDCVRI